MLNRHGADRRSHPRLLEHFDAKANGLNLIRLLLAAQVIVWHTYAVLGIDFGDSVWRPLMGSAGVDGFFAISGFLILMSWHRRPNARAFLTARMLRIFPAYYVVLLITVLVFAPVGWAMQGGDGARVIAEAESWDYVWKNLSLWIVVPGVDGTPVGVPYEGSWNASLWTLSWEFLCYMGVLGLGVVRLAGNRWVIAATFGVSTVAACVMAALEVESHNAESIVRFALMFSAGMLLYAFRDVIPVGMHLLVFAVVAVAVSVFLPDYRILAALPMAYLLIVTGGMLRRPAFRFRTDVSYGFYIYGFPVQQLLMLGGLGTLPVWSFALLAMACALPVAWLSWTLVEKPMMRLKRATARSSRPASMITKVGAGL